MYKVNFKNHIDGYIFLLLEHKNWHYRFSGFQVLKYIVHVWDLYLSNNKKAKYLPPVIPLVLYHGKGKWNTKTHFSGLLKNPVPLKEYIPDFRFLLVDISHEPDQNIKGITVLKILLMTLKYIFKPGLNTKLPEIIKLFKEIKNRKTSSDYLMALVKYLVSAAGNLEDEEIEASISQVFSEGGEIMSTIAERHFDRGLNRGKWDVVMNMLRLGASIEFISQSTGFTVDQIKEFQAKLEEQQVKTAA